MYWGRGKTIRLPGKIVIQGVRFCRKFEFSTESRPPNDDFFVSQNRHFTLPDGNDDSKIDIPVEKTHVAGWSQMSVSLYRY